MGCGASKAASGPGAAPVPKGSVSNQTLAMIKPDAVGAGHVDAIKEMITTAGFKILSERQYQMTPDEAKAFYQEHTGKPFFDNLISFMTSGDTVALQLEKEGAIAEWRSLCGPTNTAKAKEEAPQSIRAQFGTDGTKNAVHGSDSEESAAREITCHFGAGALKAAPATLVEKTVGNAVNAVSGAVSGAISNATQAALAVSDSIKDKVPDGADEKIDSAIASTEAAANSQVDKAADAAEDKVKELAGHGSDAAGADSAKEQVADAAAPDTAEPTADGDGSTTEAIADAVEDLAAETADNAAEAAQDAAEAATDGPDATKGAEDDA